MSTKNSLFLTKDNEHCYADCSEPKFRMDKRNIEIISNNKEDLILRIYPGRL